MRGGAGVEQMSRCRCAKALNLRHTDMIERYDYHNHSPRYSVILPLPHLVSPVSVSTDASLREPISNIVP